MKSINPKPFLLGALSVVSRWHELKRRLLTQPWVFSLFRKPYQPLVRSVAFSLLSQAPPTTRESRRLVSDQRPNHCNVSIFVYKDFIVTNGGVMIPLVRRPGGGVTGFVVSYFTLAFVGVPSLSQAPPTTRASRRLVSDQRPNIIMTLLRKYLFAIILNYLFY